MRRLPVALLPMTLLGLTACSGTEPVAEPTPPVASPSGTPTAGPTAPTPPPGSAEPRPRRLRIGDVDVTIARDAIEVLAGDIGPRPGHTKAYFRAADYVQGELASYGWEVERQRFSTPAGSYEGRPLEAGPSVNLIATRGDVRPGEAYLVVGAHLDTVPGAPGAEDNGSGVGTLLALAEASAGRRTRLPVVLVAFGSEEPRGPSDDEHHYGSRAYVASLGPARRRSLEAMVSLDRVGVGAVVPIGSPAQPTPLTDELRAAGRRADVATVFDAFQRSSDHWSFVRDGLPGARVGSTPYAAYHSPADVPGVVDRAQLGRTAALLASWLR